ncbi:MAG: alpha/beta fold hydrolase, partial [Bacteroidales bacterium]|nr:alpha/beta fold hydrolase [Bacteroidales bacterium]
RFSGYEFIAALGYITYIPDLIGYGDSRNLPSTFYNKEYSIKAITDFILAANEFIENLNILTNQEYYITGYSQGGFIALATLQAIEEGVINIKIKAAAIGAGGYNLYDLVRNNLNRETYSAPSYFALFFSSYNEINDWERPMTDFFNKPYASRINKLISGAFTRQEADNFLTNQIEILINPKFKENTLSGNEKELIDALKKNSIQCWASKTPLKIYHGLNDEIIPYQDSENIYNEMKLAGSENVELIDLKGNTHYKSALNFIEKVIQWYSTL